MVIIGVWFLIALVFGLFIVSFINDPLSGPQERPLHLSDSPKPPGVETPAATLSGAVLNSEAGENEAAAAVQRLSMIPPRESVSTR